MTRWLAGRRLAARGRRGGPAARAARLLRTLGADVTFSSGAEKVGAIDVEGWVGEAHAAGVAGVPDRPRAAVSAQYLGQLAAARTLLGGTAVEVGEAVGLLAGQGPSPLAELLRCRDGWLVARWRTPAERELLPPELRSLGRQEAALRLQLLRLLAAPVLPGRGSGWRLLRPGRHSRRRLARPLRVVDWSSLIAGPSACAALAATGAEVVRIEHPGRRDGLLAGDPSLWRRLNAAKQLLLADAGSEPGRREIEEALRWADLVVSGHSLRVLPQLGFGPEWFAERAPRAALVELVAYLPPDEDRPGLGEQAAAVAGLLWRGGGRPRPPRPWADPLAGSLLPAVVAAWAAAGHPTGARVRVSLEGAAGLALDEAGGAFSEP